MQSGYWCTPPKKKTSHRLTMKIIVIINIIIIVFIISECSRLTQNEVKTRHDWVGKGIDWELCKKLKFDHTSKWYMKKLGSIIKNEAQNSLRVWDSNKSPNPGQTTRPRDNKQTNKQTKKKKKKVGRICRIVDLYRSSGLQNENQRKRKQKEGLIGCLGFMAYQLL